MNATQSIVDVRGLVATEFKQDSAKVAAIAAAMGSDADEIAWEEMPAIVIDESGSVLDGHHRVAAAIASGLNTWRAIMVSREEFDAVGHHTNAVQAAADAVGDAVTWGAAA